MWWKMWPHDSSTCSAMPNGSRQIAHAPAPPPAFAAATSRASLVCATAYHSADDISGAGAGTRPSRCASVMPLRCTRAAAPSGAVCRAPPQAAHVVAPPAFISVHDSHSHRVSCSPASASTAASPSGARFSAAVTMACAASDVSPSAACCACNRARRSKTLRLAARRRAMGSMGAGRGAGARLPRRAPSAMSSPWLRTKWSCSATALISVDCCRKAAAEAEVARVSLALPPTPAGGGGAEPLRAPRAAAAAPLDCARAAPSRRPRPRPRSRAPPPLPTLLAIPGPLLCRARRLCASSAGLPRPACARAAA